MVHGGSITRAMVMNTITILGEKVATVAAQWADGRPLIDPAELPEVIGWTLKPEGLCRDDQCILVKDGSAIRVGDKLDLSAAAKATDHPTLLDADASIMVVGHSNAVRSAAFRNRLAPNFTLADLNGVSHSLSQYAGKKRLLVAFASW